MLAILFVLMTVFYQRPSGEIILFGNVCDAQSWVECYRPRVSAGFPFAFIFDKPGITVEDNASFLEDDIRLLPFVMNVWLYTVLFLFTWKSIKN